MYVATISFVYACSVALSDRRVLPRARDPRRGKQVRFLRRPRVNIVKHRYPLIAPWWAGHCSATPAGALPRTLAVLEWSPRAGITEIPLLPPGGWEVSVGAVFRGRPGPVTPTCGRVRPPGRRAGRFDEFSLDSGFVTPVRPCGPEVRREHRRASGSGLSRKTCSQLR